MSSLSSQVCVARLRVWPWSQQPEISTLSTPPSMVSRAQMRGGCGIITIVTCHACHASLASVSHNIVTVLDVDILLSPLMSDLAGWGLSTDNRGLTSDMVTTSWAPGAATWPGLALTADHTDDLTQETAVMRSTGRLSFINPVFLIVYSGFRVRKHNIS